MSFFPNSWLKCHIQFVAQKQNLNFLLNFFKVILLYDSVEKLTLI